MNIYPDSSRIYKNTDKQDNKTRISHLKIRTNADEPRLKDGKIYLRLLQHEASKLLFVRFKMVVSIFKIMIFLAGIEMINSIIIYFRKKKSLIRR